MVELLHRPHQADRALLHEVGEREPVVLALEALGHVDDEAQVRLDHALLRGEVPALHPARQAPLLLRREQRSTGDLGEEAGEPLVGLHWAAGRHGGHRRAAP